MSYNYLLNMGAIIAIKFSIALANAQLSHLL